MVQVYNPRIDRWVKIDSRRGGIVSVKKSPGPYKHVTKYRKKR
jgi:hypothetical protein